MKKLMFAVAALAAGVACAAITSENVVGYSSNELRFGSIGLVSQFIGVGSQDGTIDLQDIKCNDAASDSVSLSLLNSTGLAGDSYFWINWYGEEGNESCWVDGGYEKVNGFPVAPGQGLWVQGDSADQAFISAGQVSTSDIEVTLQFGSTMTGNPTPVTLDLQDILCGEGCSDSVSLSLLNSTGLAGDSYFWINWYGEEGNESCWVDGGYEKVEGFTVTPGMGLWIQGDSDEQVVTFPGVEL